MLRDSERIPQQEYNDGDNIRNWWLETKETVSFDRKDVFEAWTGLHTKLSTDYMSPEDIVRVENAALYGFYTHDKRPLSPENRIRKDKITHYFVHCFAVASILEDYKVDVDTIVAGLLHDSKEDTETSIEELFALFGEDVANTVRDLSKVRYVKTNDTDIYQLHKIISLVKPENQDGNLRAMFIKVADQLHSAQTLHNLKKPRRKVIGNRIINVIAPLADRVGLHNLEDESLTTVYTKLYPISDESWFEARQNRVEWNSYLFAHPIIDNIHAALDGQSQNIHYWFEQDNLVDFIDPVTFTPIQKDKSATIYVSTNVKDREKLIKYFSRYQSEETRARVLDRGSVAIPGIRMGDSIFTIQFVPLEASEEQLISVADLFRYQLSEEDRAYTRSVLDRRLEPTRTLIRRYEENLEPRELVEALSQRFNKPQIATFSPNEIIWMNANATAADFAFEIHGNLFLSAQYALINNEPKPLSTILNPGDRVEIIPTANNDWSNLSPKLLLDGITNPKAIRAYQRALRTIYESKNESNISTDYNRALSLSKLSSEEFDQKYEEVKADIRPVGLELLSRAYKEKYSKKPDFLLWKTWKFIREGLRGKFRSWNNLIAETTFGGLAANQIREFLYACDRYEQIRYATDEIPVREKEGVLEVFGRKFRQRGISINNFVIVDDQNVEAGYTKIKFNLEPVGARRPDYERAIEEARIEANRKPKYNKDVVPLKFDIAKNQGEIK